MKSRLGAFVLRPVPRASILILAGAAAGFLGALLGSGGGIILTFVFAALFRERERRDVLATVIAAIMPMSVLSACLYIGSGRVEIGDAVRFAVPAVIGGAVGAFLLRKLPTAVLKVVFALLVIWAGASMVF